MPCAPTSEKVRIRAKKRSASLCDLAIGRIDMDKTVTVRGTKDVTAAGASESNKGRRSPDFSYPAASSCRRDWDLPAGCAA